MTYLVLVTKQVSDAGNRRKALAERAQMMAKRTARLVVLASTLGMASCSVGVSVKRVILAACSHPEFSDDDYRRAALSAVGLMKTYASSEEDVRGVDEQVGRLRPWAKQIKDPCMRAQVDDWLDYFKRTIRSSWQDQKTFREGRAARDRDREQEDARERNLLQKENLPPKPEGYP